MNRFFCFLMQHKNKLQLLRIAIMVAAIAAATLGSVGVSAGPFDDIP